MSISDLIDDRAYKSLPPGYITKNIRIPGTSILLNKGDKVYLDIENDRVIVESSTKKPKSTSSKKE